MFYLIRISALDRADELPFAVVNLNARRGRHVIGFIRYFDIAKMRTQRSDQLITLTEFET